MAIRNLRYDTDEILRKKSKPIEVVDNKIRQLALDMLDTMYLNDGIGLAAPQVGVLKRLLTYDMGEGPNVCINPKILKVQGKQCGEEGCLSFPNTFGMVERPLSMIIEYVNIEGKRVKKKIKDLEAIVFSHEYDHLDGILFIDKATGLHKLTPEEIENMMGQDNKQKEKKKK